MKKKQERNAAKAAAHKDGARETSLDNRRARYEYEKLD